MLGILAQEMPGTVYFSYNRTVQYYFFFLLYLIKVFSIANCNKT